MRVSNILFWLGVVTFVGYFFLFQKHIGTLTPEQKEDFVKRSLPGRWVNLLTAVPLAAIFIAENFYVRVVAALAMLIFLIVGTTIHHKSLKGLRFSDEFITKLRRLSYIAALSVVFFFGYIFLDTKIAK